MRKFLVGALLFLVFAVVLAPAGALKLALDGGAVALSEPTGTIWDGTGRVHVAGIDLGLLAWDFRPVTLLKGGPGYDFALSGTDQSLAGHIKGGYGGGWAVRVSGTVGARFVNRWLAPYDMMLSGDISLDGVELSGRGGAPGAAAGTARWTGGPVRYVLSGQVSSASLPALVAHLGEGPEAVVYEQDGQVPLLRATLLDNGFARVGVTKYLTRLVGNPWPGSDPDHAVVLEVEEQVF